MRIVHWTPAEARDRMSEAMTVYAEAMGYPPEAGQHRAGFALAHTRRPQFRAVAALGDGDGVGEDRKSTRLNSSHLKLSRMPSSA